MIARNIRILDYITGDNQLSFRAIQTSEGLSAGLARQKIKELEREHGVSYFGTAAAKGGVPYGLTDDSRAMRARLSDALHAVARKQPDKAAVSALTGLNRREQRRAIERPFRHDWTVSQIERLARLVGRSVADLCT